MSSKRLVNPVIQILQRRQAIDESSPLHLSAVEGFWTKLCAKKRKSKVWSEYKMVSSKFLVINMFLTPKLQDELYHLSYKNTAI